MTQEEELDLEERYFGFKILDGICGRFWCSGKPQVLCWVALLVHLFMVAGGFLEYDTPRVGSLAIL